MNVPNGGGSRGNPRSRLTSALQDRYTIDRELGAGGMATVYLAHDLKHDRKVALKVLKPELAAVVGSERFLAEIRTTANLQHPHILPLFDSGEADGFLFFVMPYVEGESLRDRLDREKQLPVDEAVRIATEVADALGHAHGKGVIHRDIKPANILLRDGRVQVADFGIALAVQHAGGTRLTETGLSVGTPHYMSPEQASGDRELDGRSDVYSLGCVLYEMLAGEPPHVGPTAQSILAKILTEEPKPIGQLRRSVPPHVEAAVHAALEKLPADRFRDADTFQKALGNAGFDYSTRPHPGGDSPSGRQGGAAVPAQRYPRVVLLSALVVVATMAAVWGWLRSPGANLATPTTRALIDLSGIQLLLIDEVIVSPDGSHLAVTGTLDGQRRLFVRNAAESFFRPLMDAVSPSYPAFSPDGEWIVYENNSEGSLMRIPVSGGVPRTVVPASSGLDPNTPHWGDDGTIVFASLGGGVYRVPETGGSPTLIANGPYWHPVLLPGGTGVLLTAGEDRSTHHLDLATGTMSEIIARGVDAQYVPTGHLLYADPDGVLWAVAFDPDRGETTGEPIPVLDGITVSEGAFARYSVSDNGTLVYGAGGISDRELVSVSMDGAETVLLRGDLSGPRWSQDGRSLAFRQRSEESGSGIYVYDVNARSIPRQLTFGETDSRPVWSPDGERIAFTRHRNGGDTIELLVKAVQDDAPPQLILTRERNLVPSDWIEGGKLLFTGGQERDEVWTMLVSDSTSAASYLRSEGDLRDPLLSPRGDFMVYSSAESGVSRVFARSYPVPNQQVTVSVTEGAYPRWSPDGQRIYYWKSRTPGVPDSLFAAQVRHDPSFAVFSTQRVLSGEYIVASWDLHPAGDRFAVVRDPGLPDREMIVTNWFEEWRPALERGGR